MAGTCRANGLRDPDRIFPGQHLEIGEGGAPQPGPKATAPPPQQQAPQSSQPESQSEAQSSPQTSQAQAPRQSSQVPQQSSHAPQARPKRQSSAAVPSAGGAKAEIIRRESSGNPRAQNGKYHGLFQTDQSWGRGTVAEQHAGAERYVRERYGSWEAALRFHNRHGWY